MKALLPSSILATFPTHLNLLDLITLTILGKRYKLWSSSLWSLLHSPISSLLGPNIRLRILFPNTLSYISLTTFIKVFIDFKVRTPYIIFYELHKNNNYQTLFRSHTINSQTFISIQVNWVALTNNLWSQILTYIFECTFYFLRSIALDRLQFLLYLLTWIKSKQCFLFSFHSYIRYLAKSYYLRLCSADLEFLTFILKDEKERNIFLEFLFFITKDSFQVLLCNENCGSSHTIRVNKDKSCVCSKSIRRVLRIACKKRSSIFLAILSSVLVELGSVLVLTRRRAQKSQSHLTSNNVYV